jgi:hypothetical protein
VYKTPENPPSEEELAKLKLEKQSSSQREC